MEPKYEHAHMIIEGLWLGDYIAAHDFNFIKKNNIQAIVNATKDIPCKFKEIDYLQVNVDDPGPNVHLSQVDIQEMIRMFPNILSFIERNRVLNKNILVHCHAGAQRSAVIVLLYLMLYVFTGAKENRYQLARRYLQSQRPIVFYYGYSMNFQPALAEYLRDLP